MLIDDHCAKELSYSAVRGYVRVRRTEIDVEAGRQPGSLPMPVAESLNELNDRIGEWEAQVDGQRISDRIRTIRQDFSAEQSFLAPVNGQFFLPTGGQLMCPLVASKTAR